MPMQHTINNAEWPYNNIMVSTRHQLMFTPIAKNAHTSLKRMFVQLSGHPQSITLLRGDIHSNLVSISTGLRLADYSSEQAQSHLQNPDHTHITVLRNPLSRAVSGYVSKFVTLNPSASEGTVQSETHPAIDWVYTQKGQAPNFQQSITFNEFVEYLFQADDDELDTHFKSQSAYLRHQSINHWFRTDRLDRLTDFLQDYLCQSVMLGHIGSVQRKKTLFRRKHKDNMLPVKLRGKRATPLEHELLTSDNVEKLSKRFAEDMQRWEQCQ